MRETLWFYVYAATQLYTGRNNIAVLKYTIVLDTRPLHCNIHRRNRFWEIFFTYLFIYLFLLVRMNTENKIKTVNGSQKVIYTNVYTFVYITFWFAVIYPIDVFCSHCFIKHLIPKELDLFFIFLFFYRNLREIMFNLNVDAIDVLGRSIATISRCRRISVGSHNTTLDRASGVHFSFPFVITSKTMRACVDVYLHWIAFRD